MYECTYMKSQPKLTYIVTSGVVVTLGLGRMDLKAFWIERGHLKEDWSARHVSEEAILDV